MEKHDAKKKPVSKPYWFERLPTGEKVLCFSVKRHGEKKTVKLTMEQIGRAFREA